MRSAVDATKIGDVTSLVEHRSTGTEIVDGLRGLAILWVLCYHTWLFSWYTPALHALGIDVPVDVLPRVGYLGVDLFFLISGYCLFVPHARSAVLGMRDDVPLHSFVARRTLKIVPSYALALLATAPLALPYVHGRLALWTTLGVHFAFVQNFFDDDFGQANSVFWSLAIEVQFYLVFPLVARAFRRTPLPTAVAMIAVAIAYRHALAPCCLLQETVMRQLPAYFDVFALGMTCAYVVTWLHARRVRGKAVQTAATLTAIAAAIAAFALLETCSAVQYTPGGRETWDLWGRTELATLFAVFLIASCFALRAWRAALANPILVFLSIVSYNVYLWHTLILIWMWKHGVPAASTPNPHDDVRWKASYIAGGWIAVFAVATAVTYFVERPLLGFVKTHTFAFDWRRLRGTRLSAAEPSIARRETRT